MVPDYIKSRYVKTVAQQSMASVNQKRKLSDTGDSEPDADVGQQSSSVRSSQLAVGTNRRATNSVESESGI